MGLLPDNNNGIRLDNPSLNTSKDGDEKERRDWGAMDLITLNSQRVLFIKDKCILIRCVV